MRYPNLVVILRPSGVDEYGNAGGSFDLAEEIVSAGFFFTKAGSEGGVQRADSAVLMPVSPAVKSTDRLRIDGVVWEVNGDPVEARSPSKAILQQVPIRPAVSGG